MPERGIYKARERYEVTAETMHRGRQRSRCRFSSLPALCRCTPLRQSPVQVSVTSQVPAEYRVPTGTALEEIGLPDSLQIAPKAEGGAASNTAPEEAAPNSGTAAGVTWVGDYDPNTAGTYRLTAAFLNGAYTADNMPAVTVISSAPQKTGAALPRAADPIEEATLKSDGLTFTFTLYPDTGEATLTDVSEPAARGQPVAVPGHGTLRRRLLPGDRCLLGEKPGV